ncbi:unnamed protein product [Linum trigynum]|uniref:Uncharacterized protein n=1 Tax=Linum trigynum TaxID=586398 RepID=A0AAV2D6Z8_9ROSI
MKNAGCQLTLFCHQGATFRTSDGKNLMRKLDRDQMQMTPRNCRTFKSVPRELLISKLCVVISAAFTVYERAVTSWAALFS